MQQACDTTNPSHDCTSSTHNRTQDPGHLAISTPGFRPDAGYRRWQPGPVSRETAGARDRRTGLSGRCSKASGAVLGVHLLVELPPLVRVGVQDGLVDLDPQPGPRRDRHAAVVDAIHVEYGVGKQLVA